MKVLPSLVPVSRSIICKTLLVGAMFSVACVMPVKADYQSTVLSKSPVGYWRLNDVVAAPGNMLATNIGTLGAVGNGTYEYDSLAGVSGALPSQSSSNTAMRVESYIDGD